MTTEAADPLSPATCRIRLQREPLDSATTDEFRCGLATAGLLLLRPHRVLSVVAHLMSSCQKRSRLVP